MEKDISIKIDISNESNLIDKYDCNSVNNNLIEYLIKKVKYIKNKENIKIIINNTCNTRIDIIDKIIKGLELELKNTIHIHYRNNFLQFILFLVGVGFLFLATMINKNAIWEEVLIIIGWVPIWKMANLELMDILNWKKRKKVIKKLLDSKFEVIKKEN